MASTIKVDNVQNQPGTNIVSKCGTDVTLGASGDTVALASGASQTGFGRTGTVDWDTSIKTSTVTAVSGNGYFVNTTSGGITVNLPAASVGDIVAISDYASTSASNNITVTPNGSEKINGVNDDYVISTAGLAVTLVYADAARGWKSVTGSDADATGEVPAFIVATGGTPCSGAIVCTNYKVHTFTGPGTLCVSCAGNAAGSNTVSYLVLAGSGGGGSAGGGGGAGGYREGLGLNDSYTGSPLRSATGVSVPVAGYPITVGGGGTTSSPGNVTGNKGNNSTFSTITSTGGGAGRGHNVACLTNVPGGSGGGGGSSSTPTYPGGVGNDPPVSPPQGNDGGVGFPSSPHPGGGGGGGAGAAGCQQNGGTSIASSITGSPVSRAGGGGAGPNGTGGTDAGDGGTPGGGPTGTAPAGVANSGSGGGGGWPGAGSTRGGAGGSGVVIIRYKFQ